MQIQYIAKETRHDVPNKTVDIYTIKSAELLVKLNHHLPTMLIGVNMNILQMHLIPVKISVSA